MWLINIICKQLAEAMLSELFTSLINFLATLKVKIMKKAYRNYHVKILTTDTEYLDLCKSV